MWGQASQYDSQAGFYRTKRAFNLSDLMNRWLKQPDQWTLVSRLLRNRIIHTHVKTGFCLKTSLRYIYSVYHEKAPRLIVRLLLLVRILIWGLFISSREEWQKKRSICTNEEWVHSNGCKPSNWPGSGLRHLHVINMRPVVMGCHHGGV